MGFGIKAGLLLTAVTITNCDALAPLLIPVRPIVCAGAFSKIGAGVLIGSSVGDWLIGVTVMTKVSLNVFTPPLAVPPLFITVRVIVAVPVLPGTGV